MSNKIWIILIVVLVITIPSIFYKEIEKNRMSREDLTKWIITGYTKQFCGVVYRHLTTCLSLKPDDCVTVATANITACTNDLATTMHSSYSKDDAQEVYKKIGDCFERNMHDTLMQNYVIPSEACWARMQ